MYDLQTIKARNANVTQRPYFRARFGQGNSQDDMYTAYLKLCEAKRTLEAAAGLVRMNVLHGRNYPAGTTVEDLRDDRAAFDTRIARIADQIDDLKAAVYDTFQR